MKTFKTWEPLRHNDQVHIIAPASASTEEKLKKGISWLESQQLDIIYSKNLMMPDLFFSAPLEQQCEDIRNALESDARVIWCLRGGWGSMRLLPFLETLNPPKNPKLLIGFSDITSLHVFFAQRIILRQGEVHMAKNGPRVLFSCPLSLLVGYGIH